MRRGVTPCYRGPGAGLSLVATLVIDRTARARLEEAVRCYAEIRHCASTREVLDQAGRGAQLVVVGARDGAGLPTSELVRALRRQFPLVSLVGYIDPTGGSPASDATMLARAGVHQLVLRGFDDCGTGLRYALECASRCSTSERAMAAIARIVPDAALPVLRYCCEHAARNLTVGDMARALGVDRKTLAVRLRRWSLPPPRVVIAWSRLLLVAGALETPGRSVEQVAYMLEFASGGALRNQLKRHTGRCPGDFRGPGAFERLLGAFVKVLSEAGPGPGTCGTVAARCRPQPEEHDRADRAVASQQLTEASGVGV